MRGFLIFLGLLLILGGAAAAAARYAPVDLSMLDSVAGAKEFLLSPMALYAGGAAAGSGLILILIGALAGGQKKKAAASAPARAPSRTPPAAPQSVEPEPPKAPRTVVPAQPPKIATPSPAVKSQPAAQPAPTPKPQPAPHTSAPQLAPAPKPTASAKPPASAQQASASPPQDARLLNRKRVTDLVTINDALKAYHAKHGAYPKVQGLGGLPERGASWIPGLAPDFLTELPRDPAMSMDKAGPQYVYASDGAGYKLLAQGVSLIGGTNVEVLGVRIDATRKPTAENAAFGFWTPSFAEL